MYNKDQIINKLNPPTTSEDGFTPEKQKVILEHLLITKNSTNQTKNYSHVPCKFFKQGNCSAGNSCPFSHSLDFKEANKRPCKYFKLGNCKFGNKCANSHNLNKQQTKFPISPISTRSSSTSGTNTPTNTPIIRSSNNSNFNLQNGKNFPLEGGYLDPSKEYLESNNHLFQNNNQIKNYLHQTPLLRNPPTQQQYVPPSTPPSSASSSASSASSTSSSSSSSTSSASSCSSSDVPYSFVNLSPFIPRQFNTLYTKQNTFSNPRSLPNNTAFSTIQEEETVTHEKEPSATSNDPYYFNYSSILNSLEEGEEEDENEIENYNDPNKIDNDLTFNFDKDQFIFFPTPPSQSHQNKFYSYQNNRTPHMNASLNYNTSQLQRLRFDDL